jgi:multidrug efflux system outer membrane protein
MKKWIPVFLSLGGCMVGPNYQTPDNTIADEWTSPSTAIDETPLTSWWMVFEDPLLNKYIEAAAESNRDLLIAEANILQARAMRQISIADLYPRIGADLSAGEFKLSRNGLVFGPAVAESTDPKAQSLFTALFDAVWELDLFGKTRRGIEVANATLESILESRNDVLVSIYAEVARNYMELRGSQKNRTLTQENIAVLDLKAAIVAKQFQFGYVSRVDYETILAKLSSAIASLPDIETEIYRSIYALSVLTGNVPETLLAELTLPQPLPSTPDILAIGLKSDLLKRRPDVRSAERQLASATANIGVAVAAFFPNIIIGGIGGLQSVHLNKLFKGSSNIWGVGGSASVPIFEGGKTIGNLHINQAEAQVAFQTYQKTILEALEETEGALVAYTQEQATTRAYTNTVSHYNTLLQLAALKYEKGLTAKIDLLTSEQDLITSKQTLLQSEISSLVDLIALYKALGGGWSNPPE